MMSAHAVAAGPFRYESVVSDSLSRALRSAIAKALFPPECVSELEFLSHPIQYPARTIVFTEGQRARGVYVLTAGLVKLTTTNRAGRAFIVRLAHSGAFLGLHDALSGRVCGLTAEAVELSQISFIRRDDFLHFLSRHGNAWLQIAMQLGNECQSAYELVRSIGLSQSVTEKFARLILQWSTGMGGTGDRVRLVLTHEEIAQLIGTRRETVTRLLGEFKKNRVVEISGSALLIRDRAALEQLAS